MLQVASACMSSSVKCLGNLNLMGSQACGKVCCEVNGTQGLIPSQLSPNHQDNQNNQNNKTGLAHL